MPSLSVVQNECLISQASLHLKPWQLNCKSAGLQMETCSQRQSGRGLWNNPRPVHYSKQTQDLLRLMMQESKLTSLQKKHINECLKNGAALPLDSDPTSSASPPPPRTSKCVGTRLSGKPQRRSAEACRSGDSYVRDQFRPGPTRDLEKEKRRLQNILATGQEQSTPAPSENAPTGVSEEKDRHQQVMDEIEERRQFLADMASLGQEKKYMNIINTEISQKIRELEILDKSCWSKKDVLTSERKPATEDVSLTETTAETLTGDLEKTC